MANAIKRGRDVWSDDDDVEMEMGKRGKMRFDEGDMMRFRIQRLEKSNIRRCRKMREMERRICELERAVGDLQGRVSFLDAVAKDYENENNYFRLMYHHGVE